MAFGERYVNAAGVDARSAALRLVQQVGWRARHYRLCHACALAAWRCDFRRPGQSAPPCRSGTAARPWLTGSTPSLRQVRLRSWLAALQRLRGEIDTATLHWETWLPRALGRTPSVAAGRRFPAASAPPGRRRQPPLP